MNTLLPQYFSTSFYVCSFDTTAVAGPLIFADQFIEISSATDTGLIYGLGEHRARLLHNASAMWQQYVMWSRDQPPTVCIFIRLVPIASTASLLLCARLSWLTVGF